MAAKGVMSALACILVLQEVAPAHADSTIRQATSDYQRTVSEGAFFGALGGCAVGALVGAVGGKAGNALRGCLIGGGVGLLGGLATGIGVAEQKKRQIKTEDQLSGAIAEARKHNASLRQLVATVERLVRQRRAEVAALPSGSGRQTAIMQLKAELAEDSPDVSAAIHTMEDERNKLKNAIASFQGTPQAQPALTELRATEGAISTLKSQQMELTKFGQLQ